MELPNALDKPVWKFHNKCEFIVKLCYWRRNASQLQIRNWPWKIIWKVKNLRLPIGELEDGIFYKFVWLVNFQKVHIGVGDDSKIQSEFNNNRSRKDGGNGDMIAAKLVV
ncbi:hypothetical protein H5410_043667 [Solanum commersonii]|uniref:Uncharacterized protein n=1 Tax=Solanum commersonii TaxID=4109 RepID=A0A9J5XY72_SOLCO|nr:hypothetical protein H5410_043667 [Solanum commersonii]